MQMSKDLLFNFFSMLKEKIQIDEEVISYINQIFSNKAERVLDVVKRGMSKNVYKPSNRVVWTVMGENCEHIIYPKMYCSCQDFYKNVVVSRKRLFCKHILAQVICEALNNYNTTELKDKEFIDLINNLELKF